MLSYTGTNMCINRPRQSQIILPFLLLCGLLAETLPQLGVGESRRGGLVGRRGLVGGGVWVGSWGLIARWGWVGRRSWGLFRLLES